MKRETSVLKSFMRQLTVFFVVFSGHHAGGAALSARLLPQNRSLRQGDPPREVLERSQKHLHPRHNHGRRGLPTSSVWWEGLRCDVGNLPGHFVPLATKKDYENN